MRGHAGTRFRPRGPAPRRAALLRQRSADRASPRRRPRGPLSRFGRHLAGREQRDQRETRKREEERRDERLQQPEQHEQTARQREQHADEEDQPHHAELPEHGQIVALRMQAAADDQIHDVVAGHARDRRDILDAIRERSRRLALPVQGRHQVRQLQHEEIVDQEGRHDDEHGRHDQVSVEHECAGGQRDRGAQRARQHHEAHARGRVAQIPKPARVAEFDDEIQRPGREDDAGVVGAAECRHDAQLAAIRMRGHEHAEHFEQAHAVDERQRGQDDTAQRRGIDANAFHDDERRAEHQHVDAGGEVPRYENAPRAEHEIQQMRGRVARLPGEHDEPIGGHDQAQRLVPHRHRIVEHPVGSPLQDDRRRPIEDEEQHIAEEHDSALDPKAALDRELKTAQHPEARCGGRPERQHERREQPRQRTAHEAELPQFDEQFERRAPALRRHHLEDMKRLASRHLAHHRADERHAQRALDVGGNVEHAAPHPRTRGRPVCARHVHARLGRRMAEQRRILRAPGDDRLADIPDARAEIGVAREVVLVIERAVVSARRELACPVGLDDEPADEPAQAKDQGRRRIAAIEHRIRFREPGLVQHAPVAMAAEAAIRSRNEADLGMRADIAPRFGDRVRIELIVVAEQHQIIARRLRDQHPQVAVVAEIAFVLDVPQPTSAARQRKPLRIDDLPDRVPLRRRVLANQQLVRRRIARQHGFDQFAQLVGPRIGRHADGNRDRQVPRSYSRLTIVAGLPAITHAASAVSRTTALAATMHPGASRVPARMTAPSQIQQSSPIRIGSTRASGRRAGDIARCAPSAESPCA
ncbi:hypothetical protein BURPS1710b_A1971 [Burkholderia pseudomallei 1710b]|uniref:Uncharacterized protein n=1 Tax=Burkholderia pseudomallei (strain 1710b) TaxID=320372 RepID=Q3JH32_BURP1|nr:hypothetical protein BURPS1710b_A1971 [Burkholderia pseudomallei 1710b]